MNISSIPSANIPESVKTPADALAVLAARKSLDIQKTVAAGLVQLLDPNAGQNLNVSA